MSIFRQDSQTVLLHALRFFRRPIDFPNAILRVTKRGLVTFCWQVFAVSKLIKNSHDQKIAGGGGGGEGAWSTP